MTLITSKLSEVFAEKWKRFGIVPSRGQELPGGTWFRV